MIVVGDLVTPEFNNTHGVVDIIETFLFMVMGNSRAGERPSRKM